MQKGGECLENWPGQNFTQPEPIEIREFHVKEETWEGAEKVLSSC
jgi:hypothetical protein